MIKVFFFFYELFSFSIILVNEWSDKMLVSELKQELEKYDKKELIKIAAELYKRVSKAKKEEYQIDEFIKDFKLQTKPQEKKVSLSDLQNEMNDTFQSIGVRISFAPGSAKSSTGMVYRTLQFSLDSEYDPQTWVELLTKYSGLEVKLIRYSPQNKIWHYEGMIYVL